jgi:hypothetical protein
VLNSVYDTRFFIEHYYSAREDVQQKTKQELMAGKNKFVSVISRNIPADVEQGRP